MIDWLSLLTPKTCSLMSLGGTPDVTWEDVTASLPRLCEHGKLYIFEKYAFGVSYDGRLIELSKGIAVDRFADEKDPVKVTTLAAIALDIALSDGRCKTCNGTGQISRRNGFVECNTCKGTGRAKPISDRHLASWLGVCAKTVKSSWRDRLNALLADYEAYDVELHDALRSGLKH